MPDIDSLVAGANDPSPDRADTSISILSVPVYDFTEHAYFGTGGFRDGNYLTKHNRESFYPERKDVSYYKNFYHSIVRSLVEPVFTEVAPRSITDMAGNEITGQMVNLFVEDATNDGITLQRFNERTQTFAAMQGISFVVVDNFTEEEQPATLGMALESRTLPYVYMKKANEVKWIRTDIFGNLTEITFTTEPEIVMVNGKPKKEDRWIKWTAEFSVMLKKDKNKPNELIEIEETERFHGLGMLPVVTISRGMKNKQREILVDPPLYDLAKINAAIFNKDSEIRSLERAQGFAILYVQGEDSGPLTLSEKNVLYVPTDSTMPPAFISPDPGLLAGLVENAESLRKDLFMIAEQNGVTGVIKQLSGVAMQWDFRAHESQLKKTSALAKETEDKIMTIFKAYIGEDFEYMADYPMDFQPANKEQELKENDMVLAMDVGPSGTAMLKKKSFRLVTTDQSREEVAVVMEEIDQQGEDETQSNLREGEEE